MQNLSVVIICKNEEKIIGTTIQSFKGLTDDIVVYDNGSSDNTKKIVNQEGATLYEGSWEGFGKTKNKANALTKYEWILSLDADEAVDEKLKENLLKLDLSDEKKVYKIRFKNFLGSKWLRFGEWGNDKHIRLFNRKKVRWNTEAVHESLIIPEEVEIMPLKGYILHKTAESITEYEIKMKNYANLSREKYLGMGRMTAVFKMYLSPVFSFLKNYFFKLGFLDGGAGFHCARINALYTFLKYKKLKKLTANSK